MGVVFWKELADNFSSRRFMILLVIIIGTGLWSTYSAGQTIRQEAGSMPTEFVFLLLLTSQSGALFSLSTFLGFLGPLVGITLGFDAISGEYARGTLSRVLAQPIYRDNLINGKFFAGLATVAIFWSAILIMVIGLGISLLGFLPNVEELWRMLLFTMMGIVYVGFWLALAILFSILLQRTVTAAMGSLAVWLFLAIFVWMVAKAASGVIVPNPSTEQQLLRQANIETVISRLSPNTLYSETVHILLNPIARSFGPVLQEQLVGILPTPLALNQSLILILPHIATLFALVALCFGISYIIFMRAEIRA